MTDNADRIEEHNVKGLGLRAILDVRPRDNGTCSLVECPAFTNRKALQAANRLDEERANGKIRSCLHGVPIIVKWVTAVVAVPRELTQGTGSVPIRGWACRPPEGC